MGASAGWGTSLSGNTLLSGNTKNRAWRASALSPAGSRSFPLDPHRPFPSWAVPEGL